MRSTVGPAGNQDPQALHVPSMAQQAADRLHDGLRLAHAARAAVAAGQAAAVRAHGTHPAGKKGSEVLLRRLSRPHAGVHRGRKHNGRFGSQKRGGQHVVGNAAGQLGHQVGRGRGHEHQIGLLRQGDVPDIPRRHARERVHAYRAGAEGFKRERRDEPGGVFRHDDIHVRAQFLQARNDLARLVGRDAAGDAHHHMPAGEHISPPGRRRAHR